jgi:hypothetical protein
MNLNKLIEFTIKDVCECPPDACVTLLTSSRISASKIELSPVTSTNSQHPFNLESSEISEVNKASEPKDPTKMPLLMLRSNKPIQ